MDTAMLVEVFGYIGSVLVVVSMLMSSVVKLRIINTIGSVVSGIYALICGAFPLVLMNACLILINVYNLYKLLRTKQEYDMVDSIGEDSLVAYFLDYYKNDIKQYFPNFEGDLLKSKAFVVCCNGTPAGILVGNQKEGVMEVILDYSSPAYRDCSVGTYLYEKLSAKGIHKLVFSECASDVHAGYLKKMGFIKTEGSYIKKLI